VVSRSNIDSGASPSVSTPSTSTHPLDDEDIPSNSKMDEEPDVWNAKDKARAAVAQRYDISVVEFLDEE
jgi:hypothetical protein